MSAEKKPNAIQRVFSNITRTAAINKGAEAICKWIHEEGVTPQQLDAWAQNNEQVIVGLIAKVATKDAAWARGAFGLVSREMGEQEIWEILRSDYFNAFPQHRAVLVQHWAWFRGQMLAAKSWLSQG